MTAKIKSLVRPSHDRYSHKPRGITDRAFEKVYWPYLPVVLVTGLLLSFGAQSGTIQAAMRSKTAVLDYSTSMTLNNLLADSNAARASNGVGALALNSQLDAAAQAQANDMAARNYWSHNTPEGSPPWTWVSAQGYSYQKLGQNLAAGFSDEQSTVNGWMASPPHRENLLDGDYTEVGFGSANNPNYTSAGGGPMTIVVAFYGEPTNAAPAPVAAAPTKSTPAAPVASTIPATPPASTPAAANPTTPAATAFVADSAKKATAKTQPVTTDNPSHGVTLSVRTSKAQIAFAHLPQSSFATTFAVIGAFAAMGLWISRHLLSLRRAFVYGESFVVHHPLIDVGLLTISAISFLLTQTAGFIQ